MNHRNLPELNCCGCSACASVCPTGAIRMEFGTGGAYNPHVDEDKCVHCRLCEKVCTVLNDSADVPPISQERVYISVAKDRSVLKNSSSGGVGYVLAKKAAEMGLPVCGVTYDTQAECAAHIVCESEGELSRIQGSKYLQSANGEAFRDILNRDSGIIFGTPCQIAGADAVLRRKNKREKFILVDIFCHGVPNQLLWKNHLEWLKKNKKITGHSEAVFRQGKNYRLKLGGYNAWYNEDAFYTFFLRGWLRNRSCYACGFRRNSGADLRIGDCVVPKYESLAFSPSCIHANTQAGWAFLHSCADGLELYPEDYAVVDGIQEKGSEPIPAHYEERLAALQNGVAPEELIRDVMRKGRLKSFIKHGILERVKGNAGTDNLQALTHANDN